MSARVALACFGLAACEGGAGVGAAIDAGGARDGATLDGSVRTDASRPDAAAPDASATDASAACVPGAQTIGFRLTCGKLAGPRGRHEAALLPGGRVLIVGGWRPGSEPYDYVFIADVEVYDPATETFAVVAQLAHPRVGHRATALLDGRVLVTGGEVEDGGYLTATTEIFDPATDTISAGPPMLLPRHYHTATLLADGRVLVTGGETLVDPDPYSEGVAVAEVFDPATGTFALVGPMTAERHEHEAVRLLDGRVLLTGGADAPSCCDDGIADTELFDPATDTFTATGSLVAPRPAHRTTRLADGRVLVTGGSIAHGGADGPTYLEAAERYDPATGTFASTGPMAAAPGATFTATLLADGGVLVAGGMLGPRAEMYDPASGTFSAVGATMVVSRGMHTATRLPSGAVLLVGGHQQETAELFFR